MITHSISSRTRDLVDLYHVLYINLKFEVSPFYLPEMKKALKPMLVYSKNWGGRGGGVSQNCGIGDIFLKTGNLAAYGEICVGVTM